MHSTDKKQDDSWIFISAIGQDSHRFMTDDEQAGQPNRPLVLGGVLLPGERALAGNSDADVILHALTNALSGITTQNILGARADELCLNQGQTDSRVYLREALNDLAELGSELLHLSISIEAMKPRLGAHIETIRDRLSSLTGIPGISIGLTATSGEGLTAFGRGEGIQVICLVSVRQKAV